MSYIALARKWRPQTFSQLIGQEHVSQALMHSLNTQRLHHAYLFTGTRGVGKTSIARLFAKALNCEQGVTANPCLQCDICVAIEEGRFLDLIEIDAASKTGVDDTRQMLDNAQYLPSQGRFKIYLIDEVHMFSQSSFNALLKTLEEPPTHVKFFLATTDPQKIPVTVLSRCLQFSLRAINEPDIVKQLTYILQQESLSFEPEALQVIAHAAHGSMRDGLSLLDQALAISNQQVLLADTKNMLGYTQRDYASHLLQALAANHAREILNLSAEIGREGGNYLYVTEQLLFYLHQLMIYGEIGHVENVASIPTALTELTKIWSGEDLQVYYQILLHGQEEITLAPLPAIGFDVMLIRLLQFKPLPKQPRPETKSPDHAEIKPVSNISQQEASSMPEALTPTEQQPIQATVSEKPKPEQVDRHNQPIRETRETTLPENMAIQLEDADDEIGHDKVDWVADMAIQAQEADSTHDDKPSAVSDQAQTQLQTEQTEIALSAQAASDVATTTMSTDNWPEIVTCLSISGMAKMALGHTTLKQIDPHQVILQTHSGHMSLFIPSVRERITEALADYLQRPVKLQIEESSEMDTTPAQQQAAKQDEQAKIATQAIESDPLVKQIKEEFSANVLENSINFRSNEL